MKALKKLLYLQLIVLAGLLPASNKAFAHYGSKGPFGGIITCGIVYDTTVYLGTSNGGVFFSARSALVGWSPKPVGLHSGKITALAHTGSYLFAATADSGVYVYTGYVGTDRYWKKISNGLNNLKITSLIAIDSITVLAGTDGGGVFKTSDKGATWAAANNGIDDYEINGLVKAGNRFINISDGGVIATDDKGASWIDLNDINTDHVNGYAISYNSVTDEIMIVNVVGLYVASNASTTLTPVFTAAQTGLPANTVVRSVSNNGTTWFLATDKGVFTSPSGTINWTSTNTGLATLDVNSVTPFQTMLVAGISKKGIYKTPSGSVLWVLNNSGFNNIVTYSMITSGVGLVVAATENGVFVSKDLAATYVSANSGLTDSLNVTDVIISGTKVYAATKNAGVFSSADTGKTWTACNAGLTGMNYKKIIAWGSDLYLLASSGEVYEYNTMMSMWMQIQTGLPANVTPTSLAFYGNKLLLGTYGNGIYVKTKSGNTWMASNTGLTNMNVTSVTAFQDKIFAGTDGAGVFVSDTGTTSWNATAFVSIALTVTLGLDGTKIQAMSSYGEYVFASYRGGILTTFDKGATWLAAGTQFNLPSYSAINKISFVPTRIFVTTENNCLYSNALSELPVIPTGINDLSGLNTENLIVTPNPSSGEFTVKTTGQSSGEFCVYSAEGKRIEKFNSSEETVKVDLKHYPKGIYFLKSSHGKTTAVNKLVIQ